MALFSSIPIVDVNKDNFNLLWPSIILAIKSSSFIAMDAELSGLGNRKNLLSKSVEDRYKSLVDVAKTRSILSLGISCFMARCLPNNRQSTDKKQQSINYLVQTFNITTLCSEDYTVEPGSLKFLVDHGFDFNKQYASGVSYYRGLDKDENQVEAQSLRGLFDKLLQSTKPIILHNGLVDLVFLYQNFYAELPPTLAHFSADLCEIFPGGIFDTKYLAEFAIRMQASYLEYVFRKSQRDNARLANRGESHVCLEFCRYGDSPFVGLHHCQLPASFTDEGQATKADEKEVVDLCETYAAHGHCKYGVRCSKSHDPDAIQDADDEHEERRRKRKRRYKKHQECDGASQPKKEKQDEADKSEDAEIDTPVEEKPVEKGEDQCEAGSVERKTEDITSQGETTSIHTLTKQTDKAEDLCEMESVKSGEIFSQGETVSSSSSKVVTEQESTRKYEAKNIDDDKTGKVTPQGEAARSSTSAEIIFKELGKGVTTTPEDTTSSAPSKPKQTGGHRAGYDAFMTGFAMATLASTIADRPGSVERTTEDNAAAPVKFVDAFCLSSFKNMLFLSAKPMPLLVARYGLAKTSPGHKHKMKRLGMRCSAESQPNSSSRKPTPV